MPKKIAYWTGFLEPEREAISKEVFALSGAYPESFVFGISRYYLYKYSRSCRYAGVHTLLYPFVRACSGMIEGRFDLNHVFSEADDWFFIRMLTRKPVIFSMIAGVPTLPPEHYAHVDRFVVETMNQLKRMRALSFDERRLRLIYPGVDEKKFFFQPPPETGRFRILFASTPPEEKDIDARGIPLLLSVAKMMPDIEFIFTLRSWGAGTAIERMIGGLALPNVSMRKCVTDMNGLYGQAHATIAPFCRSAKAAPLSLLESLMAGKPVAVSATVEISGLLESEACAVVFDPADKFSVKHSIDRLVSGYDGFCAAARRCAEKHFTMTQYLRSYGALYDEVCGFLGR